MPSARPVHLSGDGGARYPSPEVAAALARVLDLDPGILRADTPLADVGCDSVAVIAFVDALAEQQGIGLDPSDDEVDQAVLTATTVGDLMRAAARIGVDAS